MSMRRTASSYLVVAGGCGFGLMLLVALDRRFGVDAETAALAITGAGALAAGYLGGSLDRRATATEAVVAALLAVAVIALTNATGSSSPYLAPITLSGGWLANTAAVVLVAALAGARLGARRPIPSRRVVRATSAALMLAGTFVTLLAAFLCARAFTTSLLLVAGTFALTFGAPYWTGLLLVAAFGSRAYRAASDGVVMLGLYASGVMAVAELGRGLHAGEVAGVAVLIGALGLVLRKIVHSGVDGAIGLGWGPPRESAELPRAEITRARDPAARP